jgi:hypothetical protein
VVLFALLIALGVRGLAIVMKRVEAIERWARRSMAVIFIGVGIYMTVAFTFGLLI